MWAIMSDDQKMDALLTVFKDPDDAEIHVDKQWDDLPEERDYMAIYEGFWSPQRATYPNRNRKPELKKDNKDKIDMDKVFMKGVGPGGEPNPDQLTDEPKERDGMVYADEIDKWVPKEEYLEYLETLADDFSNKDLKEAKMPTTDSGEPDAESMRAAIVDMYNSTDDTALVDFYEELGVGSGNVTKDFSLMKNKFGDIDYEEQGEQFINAKLDELYDDLYNHIINLDDVEAMEVWMQVFTPDDYEDYKLNKDNEQMWKDVDYGLGLGKERHGIDEEDATSWKRNNSPAGETLKLAPKKVGQSIKEGVWEIGSKQGIMEFIKKIKQIKNVYYNTVGSDDVMDGLDAALRGAEELHTRAKDNPHEKAYMDSLKENVFKSFKSLKENLEVEGEDHSDIRGSILTLSNGETVDVDLINLTANLFDNISDEAYTDFIKLVNKHHGSL